MNTILILITILIIMMFIVHVVIINTIIILIIIATCAASFAPGVQTDVAVVVCLSPFLTFIGGSSSADEYFSSLSFT